MEINENARERPSEAVQDEILASFLQKIGSSSSADTIGASSEKVGDPFGGLLSTILANPEIISKIPAIISSVKPIIDSLTHQSPTADVPVSASPVTKENAPHGKSGEDSRTALLCAMKPYLSEERRNAVDYIVKLSRLSEILKTL